MTTFWKNTSSSNWQNNNYSPPLHLREEAQQLPLCSLPNHHFGFRNKTAVDYRIQTLTNKTFHGGNIEPKCWANGFISNSGECWTDHFFLVCRFWNIAMQWRDLIFPSTLLSITAIHQWSKRSSHACLFRKTLLCGTPLDLMLRIDLYLICRRLEWQLFSAQSKPSCSSI